MKLETETLTIPVAGGEMGAYLARPAGPGPHPAVIVFMEIFGVNAHIREVTDRVAAEGYVALAPDFFHRTSPGVERDYDNDGMAAGMADLGVLTADGMIADARAAYDQLNARSDVGDGRIGAMGFCIGGHMTYLAACSLPLAAAASFYGGGIAGPAGPGGGPPTVSRSAGVSGALLCLFGAEDGMIPESQVQAIRDALGAAGARHEVVVYDGADHGFFCDRRDSFHEVAAADAWQRVKALFAAEL